MSAAARDLRLTQSTIGRHIGLLEETLGLSLFIRSRDGMQLTQKGADIIAEAAEMQAAATGFERRAAGLDDAVTGVVRISASEIFALLILPRLLPQFMQAHPGIEIELIASNSAANLLQRDADVAIPMFRPTRNDLIARKITTLPLGFYGHRHCLSDRGAPQSLEDLRGHRLIGFDRETLLIEVGKRLGKTLVPGDFAFRCDSILSHIEAIRAGLRIGVTHQGLANFWPDVDRVLPAVPVPDLDLFIACHSEMRHNMRIRKVMAFLGEALRRPYACLGADLSAAATPAPTV